MNKVIEEAIKKAYEGQIHEYLSCEPIFAKMDQEAREREVQAMFTNMTKTEKFLFRYKLFEKLATRKFKKERDRFGKVTRIFKDNKLIYAACDCPNATLYIQGASNEATHNIDQGQNKQQEERNG